MPVSSIQDAAVRLQTIVSLASSGDFTAAVAAAETITDKSIAAHAWRLLSESNANLQRFDLALSCIETALQHDPESLALRVQRALLLDSQGASAASLTEFETLALQNPDVPQLLVHLARALAFADRAAEAETRLEAALDRWPVDPALHSQLAQLRWQRGAAQDSTARLERAIERHPHEVPLRLVAANLLRNGGAAARALGLLEQGLALAPDSVALLTSIGVLLEDLDRVDEALPMLRAALARAADSAVALRNLIPALLRSGAPDEALRISERLARQSPDDQQIIAYRATALRLLGDPRYQRLHDYARLVREYRLQPPREFAGIDEFNAAFARELATLHRSAQRPLEQSLRGGSQTERNLPRGNAVIAAFFAMIDAPIRDYVEKLQDAERDHPVDRRKRPDYRIAGSWSVQLRPGGFHLNHVHPQGWLSSAYYVELPQVAEEGAHAGWLKFGQPVMPIADCPPDHFVRPEPGLLVLFPSYLWHGTVPFEQGGRRLTAAFDVLPV